MTTIPKDKNIDSSLTLLRDGYEFIQKKRKNRSLKNTLTKKSYYGLSLQ